MDEALKSKTGRFFIEYNLHLHEHIHIDDKYALDVDDVYEVENILPVA